MKTIGEWREGNVKHKFNQIAELQKKSSAQTILKIQQLGIGILNFVVQRAADIIVLMNQESTWETAGYDQVKENVINLIQVLSNDFDNKLEMNIIYTAKNKNIDQELLKNKTYDLLEEYEKEFKKLPDYNTAQIISRIICRKIGKRQWQEALSKLKILETKLDSLEKWVQFAREPINDLNMQKHFGYYFNK